MSCFSLVTRALYAQKQRGATVKIDGARGIPIEAVDISRTMVEGGKARPLKYGSYQSLASEIGRRPLRCPKDILVLQLDISNLSKQTVRTLQQSVSLRHALSKMTGDGFQDIATIRWLQEGLNGGLSRKIREAPPTTPK
jgi:hypothetical protein